MTTTTVTIINDFGDHERITLPATAEFDNDCTRGRKEDWTGVWITGIWTGPRSGRRVGRTHSIWGDRRGGTVGATYRELDESEYVRWCAIVGIEPTGVEPTEI